MPKTIKGRQYLTIRETVELVHVSETTIRGRIKLGAKAKPSLRSITHNGHKYVLKSSAIELKNFFDKLLASISG